MLQYLLVLRKAEKSIDRITLTKFLDVVNVVTLHDQKCFQMHHDLATCANMVDSDQTTVIILNIGTDRSEQTVQTQIRLLLMEQSDQGLLCLLFCLHLLNTILHCKIQLFQL